ncbi:DUF3368 domain-containing protein [Halosimplex aquaticum]|uniref:DUF3368 domain-containing protein n=1 Tax=Halosimplex aquaticum TaxID=3026162 RepID=A0ABD5Y429_9EURY|nr:DUF3368 domain-containing protein [Halosimplex aquaticum]
MSDSDDERLILVDVSVFITLAAVDAVELLSGLAGRLVIPERVVAELVDDRSQAALSTARKEGFVDVERAETELESARTHLGSSSDDTGDVGLLAHALTADGSVVAVTDDKPLRQTCKALSIPVSGSIGVLVRAVDRDAIDAREAKETLYAMDEVGARLSASLVRRAERLIDEAEAG